MDTCACGMRCSATQDLKYNNVTLPDPESQPYPWVGRADRDLLKWKERARNFERRQRDKANILCLHMLVYLSR
jgi:hypothetical protein